VKVIAWLAGIGTLVASLVYMVVSLNRWEWNRVLFFGLLVLIAEVGLATGLVLRKLASLERAQRRDPVVSASLRRAREPSPNRFAWMKDAARGDLSVFITFLVGGGVLISGIAWMVDRLAAVTTTPLGEERLATQLDAISYPRGGLLLDDVTVLAQEVPGADDAQIRRLLGRAGHA
jgi:hypothetical protein